LENKMFKDQLKKYVEESDLVSMRPAGVGIYVLKYKKKVFYDDLWDEYIEHCRGTIVDSEFNLVSYPFQKIYNYGIEKSAPVFDDSTQVTAFRKVNGFMVAVTWHNGDLLVSTTGTTDSQFVAWAREKMDLQKFKDLCSFHHRYTFMFECVHEQDPHIIPEKAGLYLLGYREKVWKSKIKTENLVNLAQHFGCSTAESCQVSVAELKAMAKECCHEGFVFYTQDGRSAKIKSPYYLTSKWVARNPRTDKLTDMNRDIKHNIDEEYHGLIDAIRANIHEYTAMDEQARLTWVRNYMEAL
jgi:hypothetical protein